jgi:hypothetical protein
MGFYRIDQPRAIAADRMAAGIRRHQADRNQRRAQIVLSIYADFLEDLQARRQAVHARPLDRDPLDDRDRLNAIATVTAQLSTLMFELER